MRRVVAILIALVVVMSGVVISSPAEALPSGCSHWLASDGRAYARCSSGSGYYRVGLNCKGPVSLFHDFTHWDSGLELAVVIANLSPLVRWAAGTPGSILSSRRETVSEAPPSRRH